MTCTGAVFNGEYLVAPLAVNPALLYRPQSASCAAPTFAVPPQQPPVSIQMPPTNLTMKTETRSDIVAKPGCLYTGPTSIKFNAGGTMTVRSPWTKVTQTSSDGDKTGSNNAARCGTPGPTGLGSPGGATVPVVEGSLVFVQGVPTDESNVNFTQQSPENRAALCGAADGSKNGLSAPGSATLDYPLAGEALNPSAGYSYGCTVGDVFVSGKFKGHMSIASENYLWVVGPKSGAAPWGVVYDTPSSVLGLVGQRAVVVWHPVTPTNTNMIAVGDVRIDAAVLSVAGTLAVQNYDRGALQGKIVLNGALAQKYINASESSGGFIGGGTGHTGFGTQFTYDTRLQNISPPKFLQPAITTFKATQFAEVMAAFEADGSIRS
jgi:hypothetical protein